MRWIAVLGLTLIGNCVLAQDFGIYVGVGAGTFDYEENTEDFAFGAVSDSVSSWKIYSGYEFSEHFGIEFGYGKTRQLESVGSVMIGNINLTTMVDVEFTTSGFKAMGYLPFERTFLFGGIGYFDTQGDIDLFVSGPAGSDSASQTVGDDGMMASVGVGWSFGRFESSFDVRLEYEWLDFDVADASTVGLGVAYRF